MWRKIRNFFSNLDVVERDRMMIFTVLLIGSLIALLASFVLSVEALTLAENKNAVLSCSLNAVVDCAAVGKHESSAVLGPPNAFLGMITLPVMVTIAVAGLAGVRFPRWFMAGAMIGAVIGLGFAIWMFYMSYSVIQVLCPWCLTLDAAMLLIFFAMLRYTIRHNTFNLSKKAQANLNSFADGGFDILVVLSLLLIAVFMIIVKFGGTLFA